MHAVRAIVVLVVAISCGPAGAPATSSPSTSPTATTVVQATRTPVPTNDPTGQGATGTKLADGKVTWLPDPLYAGVIEVKQPAGDKISHSHVQAFVYVASGVHRLVYDAGPTIDTTAGQGVFVDAVGHSHVNPGTDTNRWFLPFYAFDRPTSDIVQALFGPNGKLDYAARLPSLTEGTHLERLDLVTLQPGGRTGLHKHGGYDTVFVLQGSVEVRTAGDHHEFLDAGSGTYIPPDTALQFFNTGSGTASFLSFFFTAEGATFQTVLTTPDAPVIPPGP